MKYSKGEAKEYAREALRGIWTSLPYHFTEADELDEEAIRRNVEIVVSDLQVDGHYSDGNAAGFSPSGGSRERPLSKKKSPQTGP